MGMDENTPSIPACDRYRRLFSTRVERLCSTFSLHRESGWQGGPDTGHASHANRSIRGQRTALRRIETSPVFNSIGSNTLQILSRTFSPCTNQGHAQEARHAVPKGNISAPPPRRLTLNGENLLPITLKRARVLIRRLAFVRAHKPNLRSPFAPFCPSTGTSISGEGSSCDVRIAFDDARSLSSSPILYPS